MKENNEEKTDLVAVRDDKGRFLPGNTAAVGRPVGSKNRITLLKAALEESFREDTYDEVLDVLKMVVQQAKDGDKASQKLVWEAAVSKGLGAADKEAKSDKGFTVYHVHKDANDDKGDDNAEKGTGTGRRRESSSE